MSTGHKEWDESVAFIRKSLMELENNFKEKFAESKPDLACEAISDVHQIKTDISGIFDYLSKMVVKTLGDVPEVILSDGTKVEQRAGSTRKAWNHEALAKNVASRINDMAVDMNSGEIVMSPQDMIVKVLDYAAVSYWRVKELSKIGISADTFCEVTEAEPNIIIRRPK